MKTKNLILLMVLIFAGFGQNLKACQASFVTTMPPNSSVATFTNTSTGNYSGIYWYFGDGSTSTQSNPVHTYSPGIYSVCLTVFDSLTSCQSTFCDTLVIGTSTSCQANFTVNIQGNNVQFLNSSGGSYSTILWDFGDGSTSTIVSPWHQFANSGVYTVCLTIGDSATACFDTYCMTVSILNAGSCDASFTSTDSSGMTWFFPNTYNLGYNYFWTFGDGSTSTNPYPIHQYSTTGTFLACLTVIDSLAGCSDTYCDSVSNLPPVGCSAAFSYQQSNGTAYFYAYNAGGGSVSSYSWSFGDSTTGTGQYPNHIYSAPGNYTVCLTITTYNGCTDTYCTNITIAASTNCSASFTYQSANNAGYFSGFATGGTVTSWTWYFSDGTMAYVQNPVHFFTLPGVYTACLYINTSSGCFDSTCQQVIIIGAGSGCQANFSYSAQSSNVFSFTNLSPGSPGYFYWSFGDGGTSNAVNPVHTYLNNGWYSVCLTIIDSIQGCSDTFCDSVYAGNSTSGCSADFITYDSLGTYYFMPLNNMYSNYYWTFGDGTISYATYPTHIYSSNGAYTVCLTVTDSALNCTDTWCDSVVIQNGSGCQAYFSYTVDTTTNTVNFTNLSQGGYTYVNWNFGDGNTSTASNPVHIYQTAGTYITCLTIYNNSGCQSVYCDSIVVGTGNICVPQFYAVPDSTFGNGNVTFFIANTCGGYQYLWSFGDSTTGTGAGPFIHQYSASGWYQVCVTAYDSLGNSFTWCDSVNAFRILSGLTELNNGIPVNVFPNPANGPMTVRFSLKEAAPLIIEILSIDGKIIDRLQQDYPVGLSEVRIDATKWEAGLYMIRLRTTENSSTSRFTVQH